MREAKTIEANPVNSNLNSVRVNDPCDMIEERAARQGYFTKAQFAELMGFSVRTLERRIAEGRIDPPPTITESGHVRLSLDSRIEQ